MPFSRREFLKALGIAPAALGAAPLLGAASRRPAARAALPRFSGVYPHLAFYNREDECGVGAVVPWAGRLWVITYAPHKPLGSTDKLWEIDGALRGVARPESVGGTPASRMVHRESRQLFLGPYVIDERGGVRVVPPSVMPGRLTGTARHLREPAEKVYVATMEEGFYEVDVRTLEVRTLYPDGNTTRPPDVGGRLLPGYHGKGLYTGQGRLVYANNGEYSPEALQRPDIASGALAEWDGREWTVVRRNQFTEVTGPGGIEGAPSEDAPIWSYGWDHRSAILMLRDGGRWHAFRMPKASHTYDGAHGWHTEWPRIRDIGGGRLLMTMHGMFWDFPRGFSARRTAGIRPLSAYLKIVGDFCRWNDAVVLGADDAARSGFAPNPLPTKENLVGQSNSNLWFVAPEELGRFGPPLGRGGPWVGDAVRGGVASEPFHVAGFDRRMVHVRHGADRPVTFAFEVDRAGDGTWRPLASLTVPAGGAAHHVFGADARAEWVRARPDASADGVTLVYHLADRDPRPARVASRFRGLATPGAAFTAGVLRVAGEDRGTLQFAAREVAATGEARELGSYEVGPDMTLRRVDARDGALELLRGLAPEPLPYAVDAASVVVTDREGRRWRLPRGSAAMQRLTAAAPPRALREVVTERSILNTQGHLYEVPRSNSGGLAKMRPVATSDALLMDFCSWRGLLVVAGVAAGAPATEHVVRSADGRCALWFGVVDDLWQLGKPRGEGGPWLRSAVTAGVASDPYLMTGYDRKELTLSHAGRAAARFAVEVDVTGDGAWVPYAALDVPAGRPLTHRFPEGFGAYWVRLTAADTLEATAQFRYS